MVKTKKTAGSVSDATPRKSSRISEAKRKATEEVSPASTKKIKAVVADKVAAVAPEKIVKQKKATKAAPAPAPAPAATPAATPAKSKKSSKSKKTVVAEEDKENDKVEEEVEEVAVEDDDTTKALVDEIDADEDEDEDKEPSGGASLFQPGQDVGKAPSAGVKKAAQVKNAKKSSTAVATSTSAEAQYGGIVYVGRIPHGFFEHEMRSYFSQFGDIRRLRLSRNRKTGASKHYAFIEFADRDVAEIVAKTMDNYLLFGHILRCSVVAPERIPPNLFKGANRRFKAVPWNLMSGRRMAQPKPESDWSGKISREAKRRANRAAQLEKKLGYSFDAPEIKSVDTIEAPVSAIEDSKVQEKLVEAAAPASAPAVAEPEAVPVKAKAKKAKAKKVKA